MPKYPLAINDVGAGRARDQHQGPVGDKSIILSAHGREPVRVAQCRVHRDRYGGSVTTTAVGPGVAADQPTAAAAGAP